MIYQLIASWFSFDAQVPPVSAYSGGQQGHSDQSAVMQPQKQQAVMTSVLTHLSMIVSITFFFFQFLL